MAELCPDCVADARRGERDRDDERAATGRAGMRAEFPWPQISGVLCVLGRYFSCCSGDIGHRGWLRRWLRGFCAQADDVVVLIGRTRMSTCSACSHSSRGGGRRFRLHDHRVHGHHRGFHESARWKTGDGVGVLPTSVISFACVPVRRGVLGVVQAAAASGLPVVGCAREELAPMPRPRLGPYSSAVAFRRAACPCLLPYLRLPPSHCAAWRGPAAEDI